MIVVIGQGSTQLKTKQTFFFFTDLWYPSPTVEVELCALAPIFIKGEVNFTKWKFTIYLKKSNRL